MKLRNQIFRSLLAAVSIGYAAGCAPSTSSNSSEDFTDPAAKFSGNISEVYSLSTISQPPGFDLKWLDSAGVRALSGYRNKVVLVTFWRTTDAGVGAILRSFDSVAQDLPDSVRILLIDDDNSAARFTTADNFIIAQQTVSQVLVDSTRLVHLRFAGDFSDGQLDYTETFVMKPDGTVKTGKDVIVGLPPPKEGARVFLDSLVRAAYH
jgi:hypothetical protein